MAKTDIAWSEFVWNPAQGCQRESPGCGGGVKGPDGEQGGCYAEKMAARIVRMGGYEWIDGEWRADPSKKAKPAARRSADRYKPLVRINKQGKARWTGVFAFDEDKLAEPLRRKTPTMYFVNSMSDLFGEGLTNEQIAAVFGVMGACPQHTFQVLTKRADRMVEWFKWIAAQASPTEVGVCHVAAGPTFGELDPEMYDDEHESRGDAAAELLLDADWPLPNVWLGVSCERQEEADERIPKLLACPAAVRWVSYEPALGPVNFGPYTPAWFCDACGHFMLGRDGHAAVDEDEASPCCSKCRSLNVRHVGLDWIVAGGESGNGARPCDARWLRDVVRQCREAGVPVFVKQLGTACYDFETATAGRLPKNFRFVRIQHLVKDKKGANPAEWPVELRVREWPRGFVPPKTKSLPVVGGV